MSINNMNHSSPVSNNSSEVASSSHVNSQGELKGRSVVKNPTGLSESVSSGVRGALSSLGTMFATKQKEEGDQ